MAERFGGEFLFCGDRVRHMQERARSADNNVFCSDIFLDFSEDCVLLCVISAPDILAVHNACQEERIFREARLQKFERLKTFDEIQTDSVKAECGHILINIADVAEVSLQCNLKTCSADLLDEFNINGLEEFAFFCGYVENESRFCERNPLGACGSELFGNFRVRVDGGVSEVLGLLVAIVTCKTEERVCANQSRDGFDAGCLGFVEFFNRLFADELEFGGVVNFRNNVMIVRIEPLLHRESLHVALCALVTVSGCEILFECAQFEALVAFRHDVQQKCGVENVVVERKVVGRDEVNACGLLLLPTVLADFCGDLLELCFRDFALEELFACELEFTILTNTRESNYRCFNAHSVLPTFLLCFFERSKYTSLFAIGKILFFMRSP